MKSKILKCAVFLAWFTVCTFTEDCTDEFEGVQNQCDCSSYSSGTYYVQTGAKLDTPYYVRITMTCLA